MWFRVSKSVMQKYESRVRTRWFATVAIPSLMDSLRTIQQRNCYHNAWRINGSKSELDSKTRKRREIEKIATGERTTKARRIETELDQWKAQTFRNDQKQAHPRTKIKGTVETKEGVERQIET